MVLGRFIATAKPVDGSGFTFVRTGETSQEASSQVAKALSARGFELEQ